MKEQKTMPRSRTIDLTHEQRRDILRYFQVGRFASDLVEVPSVQGLDRSEVVRALTSAGLLHKLRGETRGTVYVLSELGALVLAHLEDG
jgi:hypothetical protein